MHRVVRRVAVLVLGALVAVPTAGALAAPPPVQTVDVSQRVGNESEESIAVNPTNPNNVVIVTNIAEGFSGLFKAVSFDGGLTWATSIIATGQTADDPNDPLGDSCCDPSIAFDQYGNLFLSYLYNIEIPVPIALSTDGGLTFDLIARIPKPDKVTGVGMRQGTFRFTDQQTIVTGAGMVWVVVTATSRSARLARSWTCAR